MELQNNLFVYIFAILSKKVKENMHNNWPKKKLVKEPNNNGFSTIEIGESSIIGNSNMIYWILEFIQRNTKEARIYCVLNDRTKSNLLSMVQNDVATDNSNYNLPEEESCKTLIYSDCFSSYRANDFRN